jgi:hypothetical protein
MVRGSPSTIRGTVIRNESTVKDVGVGDARSEVEMMPSGVFEVMKSYVSVSARAAGMTRAVKNNTRTRTA